LNELVKSELVCLRNKYFSTDEQTELLIDLLT